MPKTTVMRDSDVGDQWIKDACEANPVQWKLDERGEKTGNILTCPVRLSFCDSLLEAKPQMRSDPNSRLVYATTILFPPFAKMDIFWEEYNRVAKTEFASHYNKNTQQFDGLDVPFYNQGTKAKFSGYTEGLWALNTSSQFKPPVVDIRHNPITDPSKVYPGVWAIIALNSYASGKQAPRKGPRFGLQGVMIVADDQSLSGGSGVDAKQVFAGVSIKPPVVVPSAAFGQPLQPPAANGPMGMYPRAVPADDDDLSSFR